MVRRVLYIIREEYSEESQSAQSAELTHAQKSLQTLVTRSLDKSADYKEVRHNLKSSVIEAIGELRLELENRFACTGDTPVVYSDSQPFSPTPAGTASFSMHRT